MINMYCLKIFLTITFLPLNIIVSIFHSNDTCGFSYYDQTETSLNYENCIGIKNLNPMIPGVKY